MGPYMPVPDPSDTMPSDPDLSHRCRRLLFRARHRGTKEADLMIGGFADRHLAGMSEAELDAFEAVLDLPDVDLTEWLTGRAPIPEDVRSPMMERMRAQCGEPGAGLPESLRRP
jgi:antitoxin CptB